MYQLKRLPEDFVVKEIPNFQLLTKGRYLCFKLCKKDWNTLDAVQSIAKALGIPNKQIGFAGSKDKRAVTEQVCSILGVSKERLMQVRIPGISIHFLGYSRSPISLGDLKGNDFEIVIRNLNDEEIIKPLTLIPNYFDEQRFGKNNLAFGRCLLKKQFAEAVASLNQQELDRYLLEHPNDYIGALKLLPLRLLRLYLNAYQSYLWNETLARFLRLEHFSLKEVNYSLGYFFFPEEIDILKKNLTSLEIPLVGIDYERKKNNLTDGISKDLFSQEQISPDDFILKQIPQLTLEGEMRRAFVEVNDLVVGSLQEDELNVGKKKVNVSFTLTKGSYATMAIRGMLH